MSKALEVPCPKCKARKGDPCKVNGCVVQTHQERVTFYMAASRLREALKG